MPLVPLLSSLPASYPGARGLLLHVGEGSSKVINPVYLVLGCSTVRMACSSVIACWPASSPRPDLLSFSSSRIPAGALNAPGNLRTLRAASCAVHIHIPISIRIHCHWGHQVQENLHRFP